MLFCYLRATARADVEEIHAAVRRTLPPNVGDEMLNPLERAFEEATNRGIEAGTASGLQQGQQQGQRALLRRLLQARFGELPEAAVARLQAATVAQIEAWAVRIFGATTIDEALGG